MDTRGSVLRNAVRIAVALTSIALIAASPATARIRASSLDGVLSVGPRDAGCYGYKRSEVAFAQRINGERTDVGIGKLSLDPELSRVALKHTWRMRNTQTLFHTSSSTLRHRVTNWRYLGENVGYGSGVTSLHHAFMNSSGHRDNILLGRYRNVGVGVSRKAGTMWVTVIFQASDDPGTRLKMPRC